MENEEKEHEEKSQRHEEGNKSGKWTVTTKKTTQNITSESNIEQ